MTIEALNPEKILVAGDWHGKAAYAKEFLRHAHEAEVSVVLHVGDFGWKFGNDSNEFDNTIKSLAEEYNITIIWVDGNHDNHALLRSLPIRNDGFVETGSSNVLWAPRAHRWVWNGVTFASLGGAYSFKPWNLKEGVTVFQELEQVSRKDVTRLGTDKIDVLLTHDAPLSAKLQEQHTTNEITKTLANISRTFVQEAVENTRPSHLFNGHWHQHEAQTLRYYSGVTSVITLDKEWRQGNAVMLNLNAEQQEISSVLEFDTNFANMPQLVSA